MELKDIFKAESKSTWDVLNRGFGFYIPPYQRPYDWDESHIKRLFEDIGHGLIQLLRKKKKDSITFIGTLIVINDTRPEVIAPHISASDMPDKILPIIDGQQRLTTLLLINIYLHDEIRRRSIEFKDSREFAFEWLYDRTVQIDAELQETFEEDQRRPEDSIYRRQPRIIRAYDDLWARSERDARYNSPIAAFIHGYSRRIHDSNENSADEPYTGESYVNQPNTLLKNYEKIQQFVRVVSGIDVENMDDLEVDVLPLDQVAQDFKFQKAILKEKFPEDVRHILSNAGNKDFKELIQLVFFANFLMNKVGVTVVSAPGTYALDMFESLNTTGEPLTIFETFRPKVIEFEGLKKYENSDSRKNMIHVEKYLNQFDNAQERQRETARLLIPFALAESGKKLPSDARDQRRYMRNQYETLPDSQKRDFVKNLSHVAQFMSNVWKKEEKAFPDITEFTDKSVVLMCMDVLGKANPVTIGPLARFYSQVLLPSHVSRDVVVSELEEAIKAMTAFFALWRGSGGTTGNLAAQYRDLMEKGFKDEGILPFARHLGDGKGTSEFLTAEKLRKFLRCALEKGRPESMTPKAYWVRFSSQRPVYRVSQALTRFLLFASIHDTVDDGNLGLTTTGLPGVLDMLTWEKWSSNLTIEHVAPQSPEQKSWDDSLYERPDLVNYLGNLTLLPDVKNSSFGNRPWQAKKAMFYILAAPTPDEQKTRLSVASEGGIELADRTENLLREGRYFHHLSAISNVEEWTSKFVQDRSVRLAELIWTNIAPWLGFDGE